MRILSILKDIFKIQRNENPFGNKRMDNCCPHSTCDDEFEDIHDLMIVAGAKTLILISDKRRVGLWMTAGGYDSCSVLPSDGHAQMNQFINDNLEDLYNSLLYPLEEGVLFLNITDCTNRGGRNNEGLRILYNEMLDVFFPIIGKFVEENALYKNVSVIVLPGNRGTSLIADQLCYRLLKQKYHVNVLLEELPDFLIGKNDSCIEALKEHLLNNYRTILHRDYEVFKNFETCTFQSICETYFRELRKSLIKIAKEYNQTILNEKPSEFSIEIEKSFPFPSISRSVEMRLAQYGQVRTLADIVKILNKENHYSDIDTLLNDFRRTLHEYIQRGTVGEDAYLYIQFVLQKESDALFKSNFLDLDKLICLIDDNREIYGFCLDDIYSRHAKTKILKLVNILNEIKHYTNSGDLISDLASVMSRCHSNNISFGYYPMYFFKQGLVNVWSEIIANGCLDNDLLEKYLFTDHEKKVAELGLNEVIRQDFIDDSPCHPVVFFPKKIGTAPVYVQYEFLSEPCTGEPIYIKSCGEGKGPNRGFELYEFESVEHILYEECEKGCYLFVNEFYIPIADYQKRIYNDSVHYMPKAKRTRPIFKKWYGRLNFNSEKVKSRFVTEILEGKEYR